MLQLVQSMFLQTTVFLFLQRNHCYRMGLWPLFISSQRYFQYHHYYIFITVTQCRYEWPNCTTFPVPHKLHRRAHSAHKADEFFSDQSIPSMNCKSQTDTSVPTTTPAEAPIERKGNHFNAAEVFIQLNAEKINDPPNSCDDQRQRPTLSKQRNRCFMFKWKFQCSPFLYGEFPFATETLPQGLNRLPTQ